MQVFENPYAMISVLVICFVILIAGGVYFAAKGVKMVNSGTKNDFTTISKIENEYKKLGKTWVDRCVMYINVSSENTYDLYAEPNIFSKLKFILLYVFSKEESSMIAQYDENSFIVLADWDMESVQKNIDNCQELNKGLLNTITIRIGSYFSVGTQASFQEALSLAKQACVMAKNNNLPYVQWDVSRGKALEKKIKIEDSIEKEIDNNRFFLEYQPVLNAGSRNIIGAEVLSRLNSENDGVLSPGSFLSAVDSVGINRKFDYYILEKNCKWISNDKKQRERYKYTINFSKATLSEPEFVYKLMNIIEKYDLELSSLAVEISEDKKITEEEKKQMMKNLSLLKAKGITVLLDNFGGENTTFDDLQNFAISIVKIDKSITQKSITDAGFIILKNIIHTAQEMGIQVLCEGIETKEQEEAVIKAGCDLLQGFYYYKPMSVTALETLFENNDCAGI